MSEFAIRLATVADIDVLSRHRVEMWNDMGRVITPPDNTDLDNTPYDEIFRRCRPYFEKHLRSDDYVAWVVYEIDAPENIVAGGGVEVHDVLPYPNQQGVPHPTIQKAHIVNVFTEQAYRRMGLAKLVMQTILAWCTQQGIGQISLHTSEEGRVLYADMGFKSVKNAMRLSVE